ncbi:MAG: DUF5656 family protein [Candidatus Dormibacteraceae bacterium]
MKTPPPIAERLTPAAGAEPLVDTRFLALVGLVLIALAFGFKSELIGPGQSWSLGAALVIVAGPALFTYLRVGTGELPAVEHFVPAVIAAIAITGLSVLVAEWWKYALMTVAYGAFFVVTSHLDHRRLRASEKPGHVIVQEAIQAMTLAIAFLVVIVATSLSLPLRLGWIFVIAVLAAFRSFRVLGRPMPGNRAFLFAILVGQVVTFFAWAVSVYVPFNEGTMAVMLMLAWYINRGVIRHTAEETLSRQIALEYGAFAAILAFLFFTSAHFR